MLVILSSQQTETPKTSNSEPYVSLEDVTREEYAADLRSRENHKATNSDKNRESFSWCLLCHTCYTLWKFASLVSVSKTNYP